MAERQRYHESVIASVPDPLAAVVHLAAAQGSGDYVCYEGPHGWAFASGVAAELIADRNRIVLRSAAGATVTQWGSQALSRLPYLLDSVPIWAWRAYGWSGFDLAPANDGLLDLVGDRAFLHLMIPETEVRFYSSGTLLRALDSADLGFLQAILASSGAAEYRPEPVAVETRGVAQYLDALNSALTEIKAGRLQMVTLSQTVPLGDAIDLARTYAVGRRASTPARSYLLSLGGQSLAGFSPQTLVEVTTCGSVVANPLAAIPPTAGAPESGNALWRDFPDGSPEIFEHAISVTAAHSELAGVCGDSPVEVTAPTVIVRRGAVQHLASSLRSSLTGAHGAWDAFAAMFPAVTASGVPKPPAYAVIRQLEGTERGLYGGAVLSYDSSGAMDAAAVLRTVFQQDGRAWLRAGAGIVEQSLPAREYAETCGELSSVARYLVPQRQ